MTMHLLSSRLSPSLVSARHLVCDQQERRKVTFLTVNPLFMDKLFNFRKLFRDAALQSNPRHMGSLAVTWVDKIFAQLTIFIVNVASASAPAPAALPQATASEPIQLQMHHDMVHAAIQLPGGFFFLALFFL